MQLKELQDHDVTDEPTDQSDELTFLLAVSKIGEAARYLIYKDAEMYTDEEEKDRVKYIIGSLVCIVGVIANQLGVSLEDSVDEYVEQWEVEQESTEMQEEFMEAVKDGDYDAMAEVLGLEDDTPEDRTFQ